jgi:hypothetical protein
MKQADLVSLVQAGDITDIVLFKGAEGQSWQVHAYGTVADKFGNKLMTGRTREPKTYTSIDRAYSALRELGYTGKITVDG